jgi:hypothetical protein
MDKTSTKLLIMITTAAIAAMATTTTISAATPAFAKVNCTDNPDGTTTCRGGDSFKTGGLDIPGGHGGRFTTDLDSALRIETGGVGQNTGDTVGGQGRQIACDLFNPICPKIVGGSGLHDKGPGGNSDR